MNNDNLQSLTNNAISLLKELIATPAFSKEEDQTAGILTRFLAVNYIEASRIDNNVFASNRYFDESKPTILLNSHHDTVRPNKAYKNDPFTPIELDGKLFGLGSNDAGGALVSLIATFIYFYNKQNLQYNLILAATAEEEISGQNGIEALLKQESFQRIFRKEGACAIVGEPTQMQMAVAERGLMVLDCIAHGKAGHAARDEGENSIYTAIQDIEWFSNYKFSKVSDLLGPVKMSTTVVETENKAHNVIPAECRFVVDTRVNELYNFEEILSVIKQNIKSEVTPRSTRLKSTFISLDHPLVKAGLSLGMDYYGSPTTSDKALIPFPTLKIGPGDSARSHIADEYIFVNEIKEGIELYIRLLEKCLF